jgi:hypothetical protein
MASTYTTSLTLTKIGNGEQSGSWGDTTNTNWQLIEDAVAGVAQVTISGTSGATLSVANGTTDQSRNAVIVVTGSASGVNAIVAPLVKKVYIISNQTTGGFAITIGATTGSTVTIANGLTTLVYCDGTNFSSGITGFTGGNLSITGTISATGTITAPVFSGSLGGGAANKIPYQTGASATNFIDAPPSAGSATILTYTPGSGFSWSTGTVSALAGGTTNSLVYQSSPGVTQFFAKPGTSDIFYLTYNGATNQFVWSLGGSVTSVSGGTNISVTGTGANPSVNLNGTVAVGNGGTGLSTSGTAGNLLVSNGSVWASQSPATANLAALNTANSFSGLNYFSNLSYFGGNTTTNSMVLSSSSVNFYSSITGNLYNSIYYATSSTSLTDQQYNFNFKNPAGSSAINAFIFAGDGGAYKTGGGNWGSVSDSRLKNNPTPLTGALNKINALNPVTYSWKYETTEPTVGFIAQEVQQVIPNAVSSHVPNDQEKPFINDRTLSIGWQNDMTAYLVGAIKELNAKVDAQAAKIAALQAKVGA